MTTINASTTTGLVLFPATYTNPVVIGPGVTITNTSGPDAIATNVGSLFTIVNDGVIAGSSAIGSIGVFIGAGASITNGDAASIKGRAFGIAFSGSGPDAVMNFGSIAGIDTNAIGIFLGVGSVTNAASGSISGGDQGINSYTTATVTNYGVIAGTATGGVDLLSGSVTNATSASILGGRYGILVSGTIPNAGTVVNDGSIVGYATIASGSYASINAGVVLNTGVVSNLSNGTIRGFAGIFGGLLGGALSVMNAGKIAGDPASGKGIAVNAGGSVTNQKSGTISGRFGIDSPAASLTVANAGTISGLLDAVRFAAGYTNLLMVDPDAVFVGAVDGGNTIGAASISTLELASGSSTGTLVGIGTQFVNFAHVTVDAGAEWALTNADSIATGATLSNFGTLLDGDVTLAAGAALLNAVGGVIAPGTEAGLDAAVTGLLGGSAIYAFNAGTIDERLGISAGIGFSSGGTILNTGSGVIRGAFAGVYASGGTSFIDNAGSISANAGEGLFLTSSALVTNAPGAVITGSVDGIAVQGASVLTLVNEGLIGGQKRSGALITSGGIVTNMTNGTIVGSSAGIEMNDAFLASSVVNLGLILTSGTFGSVGVLLSTKSAATLANAGTIEADNGTAVSFKAGYVNRLIANPGAVFIGKVDGGNAIGASTVSTLELASGSSVGTIIGIGSQFFNFGSITFDPDSQWKIAGNTAELAGTISGFAVGDTIEVTGVSATASSFVGSTLTLRDASGSVQLNLPGTFTTGDFIVNNVGAGTDISLACFRAGTRIRTACGEVKVEALRIGDKVATMISDRFAPVVWIGRRTVDCTRHPEPRRVWPVRVSADAFGSRSPVCNLWLSPDHALYVGDVLIPVKHLINGTTIAQVPCDDVTYYHIELPQHSVLLAEGLPAESYLDTGDVSNFANGGDRIMLYPDFASRQWDAEGCAPLVVTGPELAAARQWVGGLAASRAPSNSRPFFINLIKECMLQYG